MWARFIRMGFPLAVAVGIVAISRPAFADDPTPGTSTDPVPAKDAAPAKDDKDPTPPKDAEPAKNTEPAPAKDPAPAKVSTTVKTPAVADPNKTEWSKFAPVSTITAEVRSVDGNSVKLRVYWMARGNNNGTTTGNGNNNRNRRPSLYHSSRNGRGQHNPLAMAMHHHNGQSSVHQEHHDYDVGYFPDTRVTGIKGTEGTPPTPSSLTPGTIVSAHLVHDRAIAMKNVQDTDLKVQSIAVLGHNPTYKADDGKAGGAKKNAKKKNNN